jgi:hypothetical protein
LFYYFFTNFELEKKKNKSTTMSERKVTEQSAVNNWVIRILIGFMTILLSVVSFFIVDKLRTFEAQFEKLDKVEQKIENITKSQVQIMTYLKIPVPAYLFSYQQRVPLAPSDNGEKPAPIKQYAELTSYNFSIKKNNKTKSKYF